jgi:hypothetical protein
LFFKLNEKHYKIHTSIVSSLLNIDLDRDSQRELIQHLSNHQNSMDDWLALANCLKVSHAHLSVVLPILLNALPNQEDYFHRMVYKKLTDLASTTPANNMVLKLHITDWLQKHPELSTFIKTRLTVLCHYYDNKTASIVSSHIAYQNSMKSGSGYPHRRRL